MGVEKGRRRIYLLVACGRQIDCPTKLVPHEYAPQEEASTCLKNDERRTVLTYRRDTCSGSLPLQFHALVGSHPSAV